MMRKVREGDVETIISLMRDKDLEALRAVGDPATVIKLGVARSARVWVGIAPEGVPGVMAGVEQTSLLGLPYFWLVPTALIDKHPFYFLSKTLRFFKAVKRHYGSMHCHCDQSATRSLRWLTWLGFKPEGEPVEFRGTTLQRYVLRS